jgi:hypothetical protein
MPAHRIDGLALAEGFAQLGDNQRFREEGGQAISDTFFDGGL